MRLSKKNSAIQRAIQKAVASGKTLGGLLVGITATIAGCREGNSPASTMGCYPNPYYQKNGAGETRERPPHLSPATASQKHEDHVSK